MLGVVIGRHNRATWTFYSPLGCLDCGTVALKLEMSMAESEDWTGQYYGSGSSSECGRLWFSVRVKESTGGATQSVVNHVSQPLTSH